jgi:hypothetical protein
MNVTPFHDGYAYFTPDDSGFYIDSENNGEKQRIRINPTVAGSTAINAILRASGWSSGQQTLTIDGVTTDSNGVIGVTQSITTEQLEAAKKAELYVCAQGNGTLTVAAFGEIPTCDVPVVVILIG